MTHRGAGPAADASRLLQSDESGTKSWFTWETFPLCDPHHLLHRCSVLLFICFLTFGSYYVYDNPASLAATIKTVMGVDTTQYQLLYSVYSWPNIILSVFGGFLIDRLLGIRWGAILFATFVCLGQFVFALGAFVDHFLVMVVGRFIFGLGGENLAVAQNNYMVLWFKGKELNMVFGITLSMSRVASTINMNVNQKLYSSFGAVNPEHIRLALVLLLGFVLCVVSLGCGVSLGLFDKRAARLTNREEKGSGERISLQDIMNFPVKLWLVFIICVCYYVTVFPFIGLAAVFLMDKYGFKNSEANVVNSLVYWISAIAAPFLGILVDKVGFNVFFLKVATLLTLAAHIMFGFLGNAPYLPYIAMVVMGLGYSLLATSLWPLPAFLVPENQLGTAYGIMQSIQNLGLAVVAIITGVIVDHYGYLVLEVFLLFCLCVALIAGILLYSLDSASGGRLNKSAWARRQLEELRDTAPTDSPVSPLPHENPGFKICNKQVSCEWLSIQAFNPLTRNFAANAGFFK